MSKEFEPYSNHGKTREFSAWEYEGIKGEKEVVLSAQELLLIECEQLKDDAKAQGYAEGLQQAQQELAATRAELQSWIHLLKNPIQLLDDQLTQDMIQTLVWLCQHCIGVELSVHPEKLQVLLDEIKSELPVLNGSNALCMNPEDVDWIKQHLDSQEITGLTELLVPDPLLSRGDFYLKAQNTQLDGRLLTRLMNLFAKYINKESLVTPLKIQDKE